MLEKWAVYTLKIDFEQGIAKFSLRYWNDKNEWCSCNKRKKNNWNFQLQLENINEFRNIWTSVLVTHYTFIVRRQVLSAECFIIHITHIRQMLISINNVIIRQTKSQIVRLHEFLEFKNSEYNIWHYLDTVDFRLPYLILFRNS